MVTQQLTGGDRGVGAGWVEVVVWGGGANPLDRSPLNLTLTG